MSGENDAVDDGDDEETRLGELVALAHGRDFRSLRDAIDELDSGEARELLARAAAVIASWEVARGLRTAEPERVEESAGVEQDELPGDPWVDRRRPYSSQLDTARQLREALLAQPTLPALMNAIGALTPKENAAIVLELVFDAYWTRELERGSAGGRSSRSEGGTVSDD